MSNREWGSIGTNYLKGLFALDVYKRQSQMWIIHAGISPHK